MAVTSIWPITSGVRDVIVYACNPEKTTEETRTQFHSVKNVLEYAADELKTEKCEYVDGINCRPDNAVQVFNETRRRWDKYHDKRVCYHGYQSFKTGEVDVKTAHEIGMELANRLWGNRFEVIVATHCNTGHYHNHFVLNAVSFVDGKKFCNYKSDYIALRDVSDEICRERGVSVLEDAPIHSDGNKNEVWLHKKGKLSHRDMLKRDIEYCLKYSCNREQFEAQLKGLGYTIDATRMSIKGKGWERAVRLSNLGYTKDILNERLNENYDTPNFYYIWLHHQPYYPKRFPLDKMLRELEFEIEHSYNTATVMVDVLFYVIITLFEIIHKMQIEFLSPELRHAEKDIKQYIADYHFITDNKIRTISELSADIQKTEKEIAEFEHARSLADNKKRRSKTPEEKQQYKDERKGITSHIEPLRKRLKQEKRIFDESPHLYELLQKEHKFEKQEIERIKSNEWSR